MSKFNYKKRNLLSGSHLLGVLLVLAGLFALSSPYFLASGVSQEKILIIGIGAASIGMLIISTYSGILIDFKKRKSMEYFTVCSFKFGKWEPLPTIDQVKSISKTYTSSNTTNGISPTLSGKVTVYHVFLYSATLDQPIFSFAYSKEKMAISNAQKLAQNLKIPHNQM